MLKFKKKNNNSGAKRLRVMTRNIQYNAIVIIKHDEDITYVLQETYYTRIIFSEGVYNRFISKFL